MARTNEWTETLVDWVDGRLRQNRLSNLWLGGGAGAHGGSTYRPIDGQLTQRHICYDTSEASSPCAPSGFSSLVDNLRRIRYWQEPATWFGAETTSGLQIYIKDGLWYPSTEEYCAFPGGNSPTFTLPNTLDRIDTVYVDPSGILHIQRGTPAASPTITLPPIASGIPLWAVYLTPTASGIYHLTCSGYYAGQGYIERDLRPFLNLGGTAASGVLPAATAEGQALISNAALEWVADITPLWKGEHSFEAGIAFVGANTENSVTIPNAQAQAFHIIDTGATEFLRIDTSNDFFLIDPAGTGIKVGIGTLEVPHDAGIGVALLALEGTDVSADGPHVQFTTDNDDYPLLQLLLDKHDAVHIVFDAYYDYASWKSSDVGSNCQIHKEDNYLQISYDGGIAAGNNITWNTGLVMNLNLGHVGVATAAPGGKLDVAWGGSGTYMTLQLGAESSSTARNDGANKYVHMGAYHFTNIEEPIGMMYVASTSLVSRIDIGGGSGLLNAATEVSIYAAANTTTTTGTQILEVTSTYFLIDQTATGVNVGIGTTTPDQEHLYVYDAGLVLTAKYYGIRADHVITDASGATEADDVYGFRTDIVLNSPGDTIGYLRGGYITAALTDGIIGDGAEDLQGLVVAASMAGGTVNDNVVGLDFFANVDAGVITGDVVGFILNVDVENITTLAGSVYGMYLLVDSLKNPGGLGYGIYMNCGNNIDYGIYQVGAVSNYFAGNVGIGTANPISLLDISDSNANTQVSIVCYDDGGSESRLYLRKSDTDTIGTLAQTDDGDWLGLVGFQGVNSSLAWGYGVLVYAIQRGVAGATYIETDLIFQTYSATGGNANQLVLDGGTGNVGIGTATPDALLDLKQTAAWFIDFDRTGNVNVNSIFNIGVSYVAANDDFLFLGRDGVTSDLVITDDGNVGIGTTGPQGLLHGYGSIGGFMFWDYDGVGAGAQTVIPGGAGDVTKGLRLISVVTNIVSGVCKHGSQTAAPGVTRALFTDGGDVCTLAVGAGGDVTVYEDGGGDTYRVALWLLWI